MDGHCGVIRLDSFHPLLDKSCRVLTKPPNPQDIYLSVLSHKLVAHSVRKNRKVFVALR